MFGRACVRPGEVPIHNLINRLHAEVRWEAETPLPEEEERLKCDLGGIPPENPFILASIMGQNEAEWGELARLCEENGADAVESNFSRPNMAEGGPGSDIGQAPELMERFTAAKRGRAIPVLAKLTPNVATIRPAAKHNSQ